MQGRFAPLLRTVLAALLMLATMFSAALGGPFEDAVRAYEKGDYGTALQRFRALADDGREDAQYFLGHMYLSGKGVLQNYTEAANWFRLAAEQGRADAQYALGYMYLNGQGVKQDYVLALMWVELSAAQGNELAAKARGNVARHLNPTQISEAQRLARDWKQTPHREIVDMQQFPWSSIGKLAVGGQHCTGAVIGPNEFLSAAHCVYMERTRRFLPAQSINILLGYAKGEYRVRRVASRYTIPPAFDASLLYSYPRDPEKVLIGARQDWVIIYVDDPFPADLKPLRLANATPAPGTALKVDGFPIERLHMMTADPHCRVVEVSSDKKQFSHDCVTHMGDSGGPVLSKDDEGLILGVNNVAPDLRVRFQKRSLKWGVAVTAASIAEFLASPSH